ncbi:accessory Sec system protein Asp3 [Limosilactobacillus walteri]|uniref:Accessory Sec system protein Asp3 n=1 Tax=Limosilactobacillus walteri TaxID=2268022 RepID=A0ABR8P8Y3_9LACO|nr:accessory Sec system protein Asp3 [Limosilactobacillus walteri]MBD5807151.1 accessory Sec system protein Asp3 [Limosilactobacillus walteri]
MQQFVNEGYWEQANAYYAGSKIKIHDDYSVDFHNSLMSSGNSLMTWTSINSYQSTKIVPQLPMLRNNHKYRLSVIASATPTYSLINRLTFFDAQDREISHYEFQKRSLEFTYPNNAVQYRLELISNGLIDLHFKRFEICDAALSVNANEDLWVHSMINEEAKGIPNVLLIADGKRVKKTQGHLKQYSQFKVQPISIAWQSSLDIAPAIKQWLITNRSLNANVISTTPLLNRVAFNLKMELPTIKSIVPNQEASDLADVTYPLIAPTFWSSTNLIEPDWPIIFSVIRKINSEEG